ncbi:MAG: pyridoxal-phosphate dependent enzyme [Bacteroidota bacterium]
MKKVTLPEDIPGKDELYKARSRIAGKVHATPLLSSDTLNRRFGAQIYFKAENFQKAGAFKSRGAVNAVFALSAKDAARGVCTHSSGNHAQALARAAGLRNIPAYIVMPETAPRAKVAAVKTYGGRITFCKPTLESRESTLKQVMAETGATEIHPYNHPLVIAGQSTVASEIAEQMDKEPDIILTPVGGGGLLSGTALAVHHFYSATRVYAAEPEGADDAYRSFKSGELIPSVNPNTIADGLLTSLGSRTFPVIVNYVDDIVTVKDSSVIEAMKFIWERMKIIVEPSACVTLAAILEHKIEVKNKTAVLVLSGGNLDLDRLPWQNIQ